LAAVVAVAAGLIPTSAAAGTGAPGVTAACPDLAPIELAADHWIAGSPGFGDPTWFNALFVKGDIEVFRMTGNTRYLTYATGWADHNKWLLPTNAPNDDGPEASQEYIDLFELDPTRPAGGIADAQKYVHTETAAIESGKQSNMTYVDAVELGALSAFAHFGVLDKNASDLDAKTYTPIVRKAWTWLRTKAPHSDGVVGFVRGPSSQPSQHQPISSTATTNYGVGAFLMAGVEAAEFDSGC
jgi:hypothetical protein